ncbi:MAG: 30S ribosomal protein S12 methylthiotransferase RimO [Deltaproteobacteria bacterium]|nr:30S ribosomal protein S12 methylthiotransferase RimO [Deltaproteobacteria bacterium]
MIRTIHFICLGCPKNRVDAEMQADLALTEGFTPTAEPLEAEVIVVNTCAFIEEARRESIDTILEIAEAKIQGRCRNLIVTGCMAERYETELISELPEVDHVIGLGRLEALREALSGRNPSSRRRILFPSRVHGRMLDGPGHTAYLKIGEGCSRRCAFCAIPSIRGRGLSRSSRSILDEARRLAASGVRELNLVSQDTSAYGRDLSPRTDLASLVARLARIRKLDWIRLLYLYPDRSVLDLVPLLAEDPRVLPYVDLPLQHVTDRMLGLMRRGHGRRHVERLVTTLRRRVPGLTLRTTFIVGHPGETDDDFAALLEFIETHRPERIGLLRYSREEGTAAARMSPKVPPRTSYGRFRKAAALARRVLGEHNRSLAGSRAEALVEGPSISGPYLFDARLASQAPEVDGKTIVAKSGRVLAPGEIVPVRIRRALGEDLLADLDEA